MARSRCFPRTAGYTSLTGEARQWATEDDQEGRKGLNIGGEVARSLSLGPLA